MVVGGWEGSVTRQCKVWNMSSLRVITLAGISVFEFCL